MSIDKSTLIEEWFDDHSDDGEFVRHARTVPYAVVGTTNFVERIIFTTKPVIVAKAIETSNMHSQFGMIGRYGLPHEDDLRWMCEIVGTRDLVFLGDMDPVDLMVFAWIRARCHPKRVGYLGVNDAYLRAIQLSPSKNYCSTLTHSEGESLEFLRSIFPDLSELLGPKCARSLKQGRKIELDAIMSAEEMATAILPPV